MKKKTKKWLLLGIIAALVVFISWYVSYRKTNGRYQEALKLLEYGEYLRAADAFDELGGFKDSKEQIYQIAETLRGKKKYTDAAEVFFRIRRYKDSSEQIYRIASILREQHNEYDAVKVYTELGDYKDSQDRIMTILTGELDKAQEVGKTCRFGHYYLKPTYKDNNTGPIIWRVLDVQDDKVLLISDKVIDWRHFHDSDEDVSWETCSLRKWLNQDFYQEAFSEQEQSFILETDVKAEENPEYGTTGGNDTKDRLFLLSAAEVLKYFPTEEDRMCRFTDYADSEGAYEGSSYSSRYTCTRWLLRTSGYTQTEIVFVSDSGYIDCFGLLAFNYNNISKGKGVRPAMWVRRS